MYFKMSIYKYYILYKQYIQSKCTLNILIIIHVIHVIQFILIAGIHWVKLSWFNKSLKYVKDMYLISIM